MSNEPATALTGCLAPIDKGGLESLIAKGKENPQAIKTLSCKTVAEGRFRHLNYIRDLEPYIVDEPPALLGDDTAPNPSEASLAALGSCLAVGIHANAVAHHHLQAAMGQASPAGAKQQPAPIGAGMIQTHPQVVGLQSHHLGSKGFRHG